MESYKPYMRLNKNKRVKNKDTRNMEMKIKNEMENVFIIDANIRYFLEILIVWIKIFYSTQI